jgi:hypothetical protein
MIRHAITCSLLCTTLALATPARGQVVPIGAFEGTHFDNFDNLGLPGAGGHASLSIMRGFATVRNLTAGGSIKLEFSSQLGNDLVSPYSRPAMIGQLGISEWVFNTPVTQFGGYFENNSRFDDARVEFYGVTGARLATVTATVPRMLQSWTWNGWRSDVPIQRIVITGNDAEFLNGFIWYDDVRVTAAVPEPSSLVLGGLFGLVGTLIYGSGRRGALAAPSKGQLRSVQHGCANRGEPAH